MPRHRRLRGIAALCAAAVLLAAPPPHAASAASPAAAAPGATAPALADDAHRWLWPVPSARVVEPFRAPAHEYGAGHRGIDVRPGGTASGETTVAAPDDGVVAFAGRVVDRDVVTIDHGGGVVSTLEPVTASVSAGDAIAAGDPVGTLSLGGHTPPGLLHIGARVEGEYVDPMRFLGGVSWAVLLPCCE